MADERNQDPQMDAAGLYREEMITDRKVGAIRQLTPVTVDGAPDSTRPVVFVGQAEIMTNMGPVPLSFEKSISIVMCPPLRAVARRPDRRRLCLDSPPMSRSRLEHS